LEISLRKSNLLLVEKNEAEFQYKGRPLKRILIPARVEDLDGVDRDFYASANEELVEDALRKLAIEQQSGYFDKPNYRSGVVFTLYALREELKKGGPHYLNKRQMMPHRRIGITTYVN
jgi:hypothetical protein